MNGARQNASVAISIASGKGGVGKTFFTANVATCMASMGKKVLVVDCDLGLANMDILLGISPRLTLQDVVLTDRNANDVIIKTDAGFDLVPSSSGVKEMGQLTYEKLEKTKHILNRIISPYDVVLLDTGAGISEVVMQFNLFAPRHVIVMNKEPTSVTDAYAVIKVMFQRYSSSSFGVVVNGARDAKEAEQLFLHMNEVSKNFLELPLHYLGHVVYDNAVATSIVKQQILVKSQPESEITQNCTNVADALLAW